MFKIQILVVLVCIFEIVCYDEKIGNKKYNIETRGFIVTKKGVVKKVRENVNSRGFHEEENTTLYEIITNISFVLGLLANDKVEISGIKQISQLNDNNTECCVNPKKVDGKCKDFRSNNSKRFQSFNRKIEDLFTRNLSKGKNNFREKINNSLLYKFYFEITSSTQNLHENYNYNSRLFRSAAPAA